MQVKIPAEVAGAAALAAAGALFAVSPASAAAPLTAFVAACAMAPFFPRAGFFYPVVSRGLRSRPAVSLTFDDGPEPATTPLLLDLLDRYRVEAAFFVVGRKVDAHPDLARELIDRGHEVGCHSYGHDVFLGIRSPQTVCRDLQRTAEALARIGVRPLAFRPPAGILTPRIGPGAAAAGMHLVTYSRRGFDAGNRRLAGLAGKILHRLRPGDVILLHDTEPKEGFDRGRWLAEVEKIVAGIHSRRLSIVSLENLTGRPIMEFTAGPETEKRRP